MDEKNNFETDLDFMALLKSPSRLFGLLFPYYTILFVVVGIFFVKNMDNTSFNSVNAIYTDSLVITANVEAKKGGIMPAIDLGIISSPTDNIVSNGKVLYKTNCASCHGDEGHGDGLAAVALNPAPRDFRNSEGWTNGRDFNNIFKTLQKGIPGTGMIAYEFLAVEDLISIIHYLRTLADYPPITEEAVAELDKTYELSKGVKTSSKISLEMAAENITEESITMDSDIETAISNINSGQDKKVINLFNSIVLYREKAISIFKRDFTNEKNIESFINRIITFPTENGFKPKVVFLSKEDLSSLFRLLINSVS